MTADLQSFAAQCLLQQGYSEDCVRCAIGQYRSNFGVGQEMAMSDLMEFIHNTEPNLVDQNYPISLPAFTVYSHNFDGGSIQSLRNEVYQLREENTELRNRLICKVCLENDACVLFQPCGHMAVCVECAGRIDTCAICRAVIEEKIRAYPS
ncbi:baculoviral IAP repeat-containing protein 7-A-like isoform X2 [Mercenaria mercenaria]|nr:baculoviral IAP repeat-containing protein 7-A-like isoform X2 [Mercenaria mercenaria]XP_053398377.1 baculoviral IAP repeat-containing protein 7-A-like isoform X2 [Mercenaria mercenaria]